MKNIKHRTIAYKMRARQRISYVTYENSRACITSRQRVYYVTYKDARACITSKQRISYVTYKDARACITSRQRISYVTTGNGNRGHEFNMIHTLFLCVCIVHV